MCLHCSAPTRRYLIKDILTGLIVCEECGFAVRTLSNTGYENGRYIWEVNPAWPEFFSFEDLIHKILIGDDVRLPSCSPIIPIPSRILTRIFDLLNDRLDSSVQENQSVH